MPSSMNIIAVFSNTNIDERETTKKKISQKVLSDLISPFFGILLADMWEYQHLLR